MWNVVEGRKEGRVDRFKGGMLLSVREDANSAKKKEEGGGEGGSDIRVRCKESDFGRVGRFCGVVWCAQARYACGLPMRWVGWIFLQCCCCCCCCCFFLMSVTEV